MITIFICIVIFCLAGRMRSKNDSKRNPMQRLHIEKEM